MTRHSRLLVAALAVVTTACASAPPAPPPAPSFGYAQKLAWIVRLEDARVLRDWEPIVLPAPPLARGQRTPPAPTSFFPSLADLARDPDARLRRRAAIAIGRVGVPEGVDALLPLLGDADPDVRQMAAFGLGLIGDRRASADLVKALEDADWRVRGRAADALGRVNDASAAAAIGRLASAAVESGALAGIAVDEMRAPLAPQVEAFRLSLYALVRLKAWDPLAAAAIDAAGQPTVRWWPVAYALSRIEHPGAVSALLAFAAGPGADAQAFAARGLGQLKERRGVDALLKLTDLKAHEPRVVAQAVRALGQVGDPRAVSPLIAMARLRQLDDNVRLEVITALGALKARPATEVIIDHVTNPWPTLRGAALRALASADPDTLMTVLSGIDLDPDWSVRAELASVLGTMEQERALPLLTILSRDSDARVLSPVLHALAAVKAPDLRARLREALANDDVILRATAASVLGSTKAEGGAAELAAAYERAKRDAWSDARVATLDALVAYGADAARPALTDALADRDWAVRRKAADALRALDPTADVAAARPAPTSLTREAAEDPGLIAPPYSPQAFVKTARGTITLELDVVNAPLTTRNFVTLARKGAFNGVTFHRVVPNFVVQAGDPRGDGEGGPGYSIRDELSDVPYLRGTVGMALSGPDTGGSQFFVTHGPQPHLDGRYAVFGRVVAGMEVVDRLRRGDVIEQVVIWDGVEMR